MRALMAVLACIVSLPSGCSYGAAPLPTATARLHSTTVELPRGSYCWSSGGHGESADSVGPDYLLKSGGLKPYRTAGGFVAAMTFKPSSPREFHAEMVIAPPGVTAAPPPIHDTGISIPSVTSGAAGVYVYMVSGSWNEGTVSFFLALDLIPGVA